MGKPYFLKLDVNLLTLNPNATEGRSFPDNIMYGISSRLPNASA
jgi:hypothetical protein